MSAQGQAACADGRIRVAVVDDHALVRSGIRHALETTDDLVVVCEAGDGRAALELLERESVDVMLLDLRMPVLDGLGCLDGARIARPELPVIILTVDEDPSVVAEVMRRGAAAYVPKFVRPDDLAVLIRQVVKGSVVIRGSVGTVRERDRSVAGDVEGISGGSGARALEAAGLTSRELEVLALLALGKKNADIAGALFVTTKTVKYHLTAIFAKLGVANRTEAAAYALRNGLVSADGAERAPGGAAGGAARPASRHGLGHGPGFPR